jgi:hypothetical protein
MDGADIFKDDADRRYLLEKVASYLKIIGPAVSWAINRGKDIATKKDVDKFMYLPPG